MIIDIADSYYQYVIGNMALINPSRLFGGVLQARDWPQTPPFPNTLYLLVVSAQALGGTESQNYFEVLCQWSWLSIGTDIQQNQQAANRGDRYRATMGIMGDLRSANFPSFTAKKSWTVNSQTGDLVGTLINGVQVGGAESIYWSKLTMLPKQDNQKTGFVYGAASLRIYAWDDALVVEPALGISVSDSSTITGQL